MIPTDPNDLLPVDLACSGDTPKEKRPSLLCRAMSVREVKAYRQIIAEAEAAKDDDELIAIYVRALAMSVRDWKNIQDESGNPLKFDQNAWGIWTAVQIRRIAETLPRALALSECDRPLSLSPLASVQARYAQDAAAENATTVQPQTPPSSSAV